MRKFLLKLAYLILPLVALSYPLDYLISNALKEDHGVHGEYEVWNAIYENKIDGDIAIYGSSRAWVQINPEILETHLGKKVYNFGVDGHNFRIQYLRHLEYIKHNKKPHHIIVSVDAFTLQKREDLYNQEQFLPYMLWNKNITEYTSSYKGFSKADYYIPFVRYAGRIATIKKANSYLLYPEEDTTNFRQKGFRSFDLQWDASVDSLLASEKKYTIQFHSETRTLLEYFVQECQRDGITVTFVYAPEYIAGQHYVVNREEAMTMYRDIAQKYSLVFLDYSNDELSFKKDFFYNASHLNTEGAQLFTEKLAQDLKPIFKQ
ncbi:hypothetical protein [uncultured Dokdonia sp.]|uniref:hypothetical protein n=1 Tax=uncultured Dokdonia sp. TaxID=575653 RepID=UPI0026341D66|nr:hypothetical protein [uncultured Dokdonia sp.]